MTHPALALGSVAVITGAASGIGLAAARHLSRLGLRICLADLDGARLEGVRDHLILAGAALSSGKCHFVMVKNKEWEVIDAEIKKASA